MPRRKSLLNVFTNKPAVDLRDDFSEAASVIGGTLFRRGNIVQVWWSGGAKLVHETWTMHSAEQAEQSFRDMRARWNEKA